jgi:hypothetical protein
VKRRFVTPCPPDGTPIELPSLEGGVSLTRAFVAAKVEDNPALVRNDPGYLSRLNLLPETLRRQLRYGDWSAGSDLALDELDEHRHLIRPFKIPDHWRQFGAFDWGYQHPFAFGHFAVDEEGTVYLINTVAGRRLKPGQIGARIVEEVPIEQLEYIDAGHDCWAEQKARGEDTPSIAEQLQAFDIFLRPANISRKAGLNNLRSYLAWRNAVPIPHPSGDPTLTTWEDGLPSFLMFDTPGNRQTFEVLQRMTVDPLNREDVLKRNADADGDGGDDQYDMVRYALASRPVRATGIAPQPLHAWHPDVLRAEFERKRLVRSKPLALLPSSLPPGAWEVA